jgi:hypothetical protein
MPNLSKGMAVVALLNEFCHEVQFPVYVDMVLRTRNKTMREGNISKCQTKRTASGQRKSCQVG